MTSTPDFDAALAEVNAQLLEADAALDRAMRRLQVVLRMREEGRGR